jgi:hypothetical protein
MKRLLVLVVVVIAAWLLVEPGRHERAPDPASGASATSARDDALARAIAERVSGVEVEASGTVVRLLPDDSQGSRHQRFIVRVESGGTVLIAHNLDLAPRVAPLAEGDAVSFRGQYEWNERGGVVHWTHPDPAGRHESGWIRREGSER